MEHEAPDYIRESKLQPVEARYALWKAHRDEFDIEFGDEEQEVKKEIAKEDCLYKGDFSDWEHAIRWKIQRGLEERRARQRWDSLSKMDLARAIAERFPIYDPKTNPMEIYKLAERLVKLERIELAILDKFTGDIEENNRRFKIWQDAFDAKQDALKAEIHNLTKGDS